MELLNEPVPAPLELAFNPDISYWTPRIEVDSRIRVFAQRLLRDFQRQWRHVLRNEYNAVTVQVLARGIVRLAVLDFEVRENTGRRGPRGAHVWITDLPGWKPFETDIVRVGMVWIVLCQDVRDGLARARKHVAGRSSRSTECPDMDMSGEARPHYMVLSIRHVMLCHAADLASFEHTVPGPLFNGDYDTRPPSDLALDYIIWATASARLSISTPLHRLPVEIQDVILNYASIGTVAAARLGCLLGLGSPFSWKDGPLEVTLEDRYVVRPSGSSVESQIWFDEQKSGLFYLARAQ